MAGLSTNKKVVLIRTGANGVDIRTYENIPELVSNQLYGIGARELDINHGIELLKAIRRDCTRTIAKLKKDFDG